MNRWAAAAGPAGLLRAHTCSGAERYLSAGRGFWFGLAQLRRSRRAATVPTALCGQVRRLLLKRARHTEGSLVASFAWHEATFRSLRASHSTFSWLRWYRSEAIHSRDHAVIEWRRHEGRDRSDCGATFAVVGEGGHATGDGGMDASLQSRSRQGRAERHGCGAARCARPRTADPETLRPPCTSQLRKLRADGDAARESAADSGTRRSRLKMGGLQKASRAPIAQRGGGRPRTCGAGDGDRSVHRKVGLRSRGLVMG